MKMILLGPIIGGIRSNVLTLGYEVSKYSRMSIDILNGDREVLMSHTEYALPGKLSYCDIDGVHSGYHIVRMTCMEHSDDVIIDRTWGSFSHGTDVSIVSCNNAKGSPMMWENMMKKVPSLCLHIGDNIYMDHGSRVFDVAYETMQMIGTDISYQDWSDVVDIFRQGYRNHWSTPHMKRILSSCCNVFLWDDHDICDSWDQDIRLPPGWDVHIGDDDSWLVIAQDTTCLRQRTIVAAIQAYCEYQLPMSLGGNHVHIPGSFSYTVGDKDILFIDRRMHLIGGTPLIPQSYSDDGIKPDVLISTVPIFFLHPCISNSLIDWILRKTIGVRDLHDHWILYPDDLESVLSMTKDKTIIISGDVHMCGQTNVSIKRQTTDTQYEYQIRQVTSSAISSSLPPSALLLFLKILSKFRVTVGEYSCNVKHQSWIRDNGYIEFDASRIDPEINYVLSSLIES